MHIGTPVAATLLLALIGTSSGRAVDAEGTGKAAQPRLVYLVGNLLVTRAYLDVAAGTPASLDAYLSVENRSPAPDRLLGGSLDDGGTLRVTLGTGATSGGGEAGLTVPPSGKLDLRAGDAHLTVTGRTDLAPDGPPLTGTLRFERAGVLHLAFARGVPEGERQDRTAPADTDKPVNLAQ